MAADRGHIDIVKYLLVHGADINVTDNDGLNALDYAYLCEHEELIQYLKSIGLQPSAT
jgi:ankyrin repeat protein